MNRVVCLGDVPWNRIHDAVRWAVHELRPACAPSLEVGTRTIARYLLRAGIQVSRSTVQRVSREPRPPHPRRIRPSLVEAAGATPRDLLVPTSTHEVWHLDLAELRIVWFRYTVAALLDGYSRRLLALKVYRGLRRTVPDLISLMRGAIPQYGPPRFLITDHGCQFRLRFRTEVGDLNVKVVRGKVRCPAFNGKVERFFKTFRVWQRRTLLPLSLSGIQRKLDAFGHWYNTERFTKGIGGLTPNEAWAGETPAEPILFRLASSASPHIQITRRSCRGDPRLPSIRVHVAA